MQGGARLQGHTGDRFQICPQVERRSRSNNAADGIFQRELTMPKLILKFQGVLIKEYNLDKPSLSIGRKEDNDIHIDHMAVSGHHARIDITEGSLAVTDMGSTNGTFVNGKKVTTAILRPNDWITIGKHILHFK